MWAWLTAVRRPAACAALRATLCSEALAADNEAGEPATAAFSASTAAELPHDILTPSSPPDVAAAAVAEADVADAVEWVVGGGAESSRLAAQPFAFASESTALSFSFSAKKNRLYNNIKPPSWLDNSTDLHLFKEGIEPKVRLRRWKQDDDEALSFSRRRLISSLSFSTSFSNLSTFSNFISFKKKKT